MFSKKDVLENFEKLTEKDLCPSPTLVFYWQFYEIFENTFFTEHFRATAFDEEAWWSKILILCHYFFMLLLSDDWCFAVAKNTF